MFGKRICRRMFGIKREGIKGGWSSFHNEELQICDLYNVFLE
jgi:hypothetical protein